MVRFDNGCHRRIWFADHGGDGVQQYFPQPTIDPTSPHAMDRIRKERRDCAQLVAELHGNKRICAERKDFDSARIVGKLAKEYEGWVKAATWLLGWMGEGEFIHPKDWGRELWPQLDGLLTMAYNSDEGQSA